MEVMSCNGKNYTVISLLGKGKGGYSYLVTDGQQQYVLKQIHHEPCDYYTFGNKMEAETGSYSWLCSIGIPMPRMLDADFTQERILKEYINGHTIAHLVKYDLMLPTYLEQMHAMCEKLYPANTNIDYYPTNFVVQDGTLYYIDYECNAYMEQWDFAHWGQLYWSKTPEFLAAFGD
ncbi:MAG: serine/threonine protein kinase [Oscillospiraceae bacterium]|nr:serine/threonine protein kinase [Oscillospiraceae bacterium]